MMADATATSAPKQKVVAATAGAGFGSALSVILVYLVEQTTHHDLPVEIKDALQIVIPTIVSFLAGYFTPPGKSEANAVTADNKVVSAKLASL